MGLKRYLVNTIKLYFSVIGDYNVEYVINIVIKCPNEGMQNVVISK